MKKRTFEDLRERALKYKTRGNFQKYDFNAYQIARKRGDEYMDKICIHMPKHVDQSGENNSRFKWPLEKIQKEALQYIDRRSFKKGSPKAYSAACDRGVLREVCSHMPEASNDAYTLEELKEVINKYTSISDLRNECSGVYFTAIKRKDWNKLSSHMKRPSISSPEKTILAAILKAYPTAKKFRATKLKIPGKEYIKTLEVDILIEELGKAIEYDGKWHHSFEGLKRGHPTWPEEDIKIYHDIKDKAFLSLGIDIFRITQDEWKKDSSDCIKRCLDFLGGA